MEQRDWLGMEDSRSLEDAVLGVCSTQCMLYLVYVVLSLCCTGCDFLIIVWSDWQGWLNILFLRNGRVEDNKERGEEMRQLIMRYWDLENLVCKSIYHSWYSRYEPWWAMWSHHHHVFPMQTGKLLPLFLISAHILHIGLIFLPLLTIFRPQPNHHRRTQSSVIPPSLATTWSWVYNE